MPLPPVLNPTHMTQSSMPGWDQLSGPVDRMVLVFLTFAATKGWVTPADVAGIATMALGVVGALYGFYVNRPKALVQSAAALPGTMVITTNDLATGTPETNIVSKDDVKVVQK